MTVVDVPDTDGMEWSGIEALAPRLMASARRAVERFGFVFAGTIRRDGSPRISPVEAHVVDGRLMVALIPRTAKVRDLSRDPRITVQSALIRPDSPEPEFKARGLVVEVDERQRRATAAAVASSSGWQPGAQWRVCAIAMWSVAVLTWTDGDMVVERWNLRDGPLPPQRRRLDVDRGEYRLVD